MAVHHHDAITAWLVGLGLPVYSASFSQNHIDFDILPTLTKDDLRDLGVHSIGHRRLLLEAAQEINSGETNHKITSGSPLHWRVVTMLVCDLVGSTELAERFDSEVAREVILTVRKIVTDSVATHGGQVLLFEGDGIHVSFGYPQAQGLGAERAVRAALQILRDIKALKLIGGHRASLRIGAATGAALVQGVIAEAGNLKVDLGGEVTQVAVRAERAAPPNGLVIAASTRKMLGNLFNCHAVEHGEAQGEVASFWRVEGESSAKSRFSALRQVQGKHRLIGRESEILRLEQWLAASAKGQGSVVLLSGEPGTGKSSLAEHTIYAKGLAHKPDFLLQCSPFYVHIALYPLRFLIERLSKVQVYDSNPQNIELLRRFLSKYIEQDEAKIALIIDFIGFEQNDSGFLSSMNSLEKRNRTLRALATLIEKMANHSQMLVVEDIQWIDPTTVELLEVTLRQPFAKRWLTLMTSRDALEPGWLRRLGARHMPLGRMSHREIGLLVAQTAQPLPLPEEMLDALVERADGIPLYAEELTKGYLDQPAENRGPLPSQTGIPATLTESLYVRLDGLQHGRRVVQIGAALAREFPFVLLKALQEMPEHDLRVGLRELVEAGVLVATSGRYGAAFAFRHRLMHEAAYELLLRSERQRLHGKIAATMVADFSEVVKALPHILAFQLEGSGDLERAAAQWEAAGLRASQQSHYSEAIGFFEQALRTNAQLPEGSARDQRELSCRLALVGPMAFIHSPGDPKVVAVIDAASLVSQRLGQKSALIFTLAVRWGALGNVVSMKTNHELALQIFEFSKSGTRFERLLGHRAVGTSKVFVAELNVALHHLQKTIDLYRPDEDEVDLLTVGPSHQIVNAMVGLAQVHALKGEFDLSRQWRDRALELGRSSGRINPQYYGLVAAGCFTAWSMQDSKALADFTGQAHSLQMLHDPPFWRGHVLVYRGMVLVLEGQPERGITLAREGLARMGEVRAYWNAWHVQFAEACLLRGHFDEAAFWLASAVQLRDDGLGYLTMDAEITRLSGELAWRRDGDISVAHAAFSQAEAQARSQGAKLFEQRAIAARMALPSLA